MLHSKIFYQTVILIVKSSSAFYIGTFVLSAGLLAGCGQPGPLYMPKVPAKPGAHPAAPVSTAPAGMAPVTAAPVPPPPALPDSVKQ